MRGGGILCITGRLAIARAWMTYSLYKREGSIWAQMQEGWLTHGESMWKSSFDCFHFLGKLKARSGAKNEDEECWRSEER